MKIKGSMRNLKINTAFILAGVGSVVALAIRVYQYFSGLIDFETGFYESDNITTFILYAVLAITAIGIFAVSLLAGEIPQEKMPEKRNIGVAAFAGLFSVTLAVGAVEQYTLYSNAKSNAVLSILNGQSEMSYLMKSGALPRLGEAVFAALSIVYFAIVLIKYIGARKLDMTKFKIFSLCPLFWATFRLVQRFTRTISFMNVSDLFLEMFMIAFMMMFFMYFAQMSSNVNANATSYKVFSYGLIAAMLSAVISVPKILMMAFSSSYRDLLASGRVECPLEYTDIAFCLFTVMFLIACLSVPRIKNMTLKETEKLIEE